MQSKIDNSKLQNSQQNGSDAGSMEQKHPIFNGKYEILSALGTGKTSKVYLARDLKDHKKTVALKIFKQDYLFESEENIHCIEQEIEILRGLKHNHIVQIEDYGSEGLVKKPSKREIKNLVYLILEHVKGGLLFEVCEKLGPMGEDAGRFFMTQLIDSLSFMHKKGVVHRDLKLENILYDDQMNLKIVDFGFATYKKIKKLQSYKGTKTYMAPEIRNGFLYDGRHVDLFSTAVILFIIVHGIFPFKEATNVDSYYKLIIQGDYQTYWDKVVGNNLSDEFKDLIIKMFSLDGWCRPSLERIKEHPWMKKEYDHEAVRQSLIDKFAEKKAAKSSKTASTGVTSKEEAKTKSTDEDKQQPVDFPTPIK